MTFKLLICAHLLFLSPVAWTKNYALIIGGASQEYGSAGTLQDSKHEFAQNISRVAFGLKKDGYDVAVLHDSINLKFPESPTGNGSKISSFGDKFPGIARAQAIQNKNAEMNSFLSKEFNASAATTNNLLKSFETLSRKAQKGDHVEIVLSMHGTRFCNGEQVDVGTERKNNLDASCEHRLGVVDPVTGEFEYLPTEKIQEYLRILDKKGVHTNLTLESCHSGQAQSLFKDLKNTCTVFLSSADNVGYSCSPNDPPGEKSYTSTITGINFRMYKNHIQDIRNHPLLSKDPCVDKITNHIENHKITGNSISEIYWSARRFDKTPEEPSTSALSQFPLFSKDRFGSKIFKNDPSLCSSEILSGIDGLKNQLSLARQITFENLKNELENSLKDYKTNLEQQKIAIKANNIESIRALQSAMESMSEKIISIERELTDLVKNSYPTEKTDACRRKL